MEGNSREACLQGALSAVSRLSLQGSNIRVTSYTVQEVFLPTPTSWVSYNLTQFWLSARRQHQIHKLSPTRLSSSPLQMSITIPGCYWASEQLSINQRFPWLHLWVPLICHNGSQNSGNWFTHQTTSLLQRVLKDMNQQPDEEKHRARSQTKDFLSS